MNDTLQEQQEGYLRLLKLDLRTAWNIAALVPSDHYKVEDLEEGYEHNGEVKIDYRKVIFSLANDESNKNKYLLTAAAWDDMLSDKRVAAFFDYESSTWSIAHEKESYVTCPEMILESELDGRSNSTAKT